MDVRLRCLKRFSECTCGLFCLLMVYGFTSAFPETLISFPRFLFRVLHRCKSSDFDWRLTFHKNSSQHRSSKLLQLKAVLADPCCEHRMNDAEPEWAKQRRYTLQTSRPKVSICLNMSQSHPITSYYILFNSQFSLCSKLSAPKKDGVLRSKNLSPPGDVLWANSWSRFWSLWYPLEPYRFL
jgi:hypothetical protein